MENNYTMVQYIRRDEIEESGMWIFKKMFNILEHKFGPVNKEYCHWLINSRSFYKICEICEMMGFDIERNKNGVTINGIDVLLTYDSESIDEDEPLLPLLFEIKLVYEKPILHHIYANNNLFFSPSEININNIPEVKKIIFNDPATIVYWKDGTKTVVKCQKGDYFDLEKGFAMAFIKKCWGNKGNFNDKLRKIIKEAK